jgi:prepilin-type N-terminal cleavage/methylation domain-containing protein
VTMMKLRHNYRMRKAFTLIEAVIVISIVAVIATLIGSGLSRALDQEMLNSDVELIVSAIQRARGFTLASRAPGSIVSGFPTNDGRRYGVYFDTTIPLNSAYSIFYSASSEEYAFAQEIERVSLTFSNISAVSIPCGILGTPCSAMSPANRTIVFKRLTGDALARKNPPVLPSDPNAFSFASPYATITVQSKRSAALTRNIYIYPRGIVEAR